MSIFGGKKFLLAFLNNSELRLASFDASSSPVSRKTYDTLPFKQSVIKDSVILDPQSFQSEVSAFFSQKKEISSLPVLLVIPEEKIFLKGYELGFGDLEKKDSFRKEFIEEIPFEESELIVHERMVGRVIEYSAIHKRFADDFQAPFLNQKMPILGMVTVPQVMALDLNPSEKSFLLAFYDNDFVLALAENTSILFSETRPMKDGDVNEAMRSFDHFVQHAQAIDVKSISIILGEEAVEDALKLELEQREYLIKEIKKISILDMIADYFSSHKEASADWNLIRVDKESLFGSFKFPGMPEDSKKLMQNILMIVVALLFMGGVGLWTYRMLVPAASTPIPTADEISDEPVSTEPVNSESQIPIIEDEVDSEPISVAEKSDFNIQIFNGTTLAGEAGRLKTVLVDRGFTVSTTGNNEDQTQVVTTIFASSNVPELIMTDLRTVLESRYAEVLVSPSPVMGKDIHIIIGRKK